MRSLLAVLIACGLPLLSAGAQTVKLPRAQAPLVLCDFGSEQAVGRWTGLKCERVDVGGKPGMRFAFAKWEEGQAEWPLISLLYDGGKGYPANDWSHYGRIAFEAATDGTAPGDVALELRDNAGRNGFSKHLDIEPGKVNRIEVPLQEAAQEISLEHVEEIIFFASRPSRAYTITLTDLRLLPGDKEPLAEFDLEYPNYRGLIFPPVDRVRVAVALHPEEYDVRTADLALTLTCRSGGKVVSSRRGLAGNAGTVALATKGQPAGALAVSVALVDGSGRALAEREWRLRRLTEDEAKRLPVCIDERNNAIVDGKPFFPLGFYGAANEQHVAEIADSPFNCIIDYGTNHKPKDEMLRYLDLLEQKGLKLIYCLNDVYPGATYFEGQSWEGVQGNQAIADAVVQAYRDHPAILAWYLNDERPASTAPAMRGYYERVRELDPNHPCYIVLCNMGELRYFTDTTDVMGVDPYPIPTSPVTRVSDWMEFANAATRGHEPTWLVPQAFAWYQHHPAGSDRARIPSEEDLRTGRAPTYEEARCMTYLGLVHGAKGLIYWCYYNMRVLPQYGEMWGWMKRIGAEVKALAPVLLSEDLGPVRTTPAEAPVHARLWRHGGRLVLVAANAGKEPCAATFDLGRQAPRARPKASFEPLGVQVIELEQQ